MSIEIGKRVIRHIETIQTRPPIFIFDWNDEELVFGGIQVEYMFGGELRMIMLTEQDVPSLNVSAINQEMLARIRQESGRDDIILDVEAEPSGGAIDPRPVGEGEIRVERV